MDKVFIVTTTFAVLLNGGMAVAQRGPATNMTFFVTSVGKGSGGNLGGLSGADAHCFKLATAAGAAQHTWRAYLSTNGPGGVNARDRIGYGPWFNYKGVRVASTVEELHSDHANINRMTVLTERGQALTTTAGKHFDILTGSKPDGTAVPLPVTARGRGAARGAPAEGGRGGAAADGRGARGAGDGRGAAPAAPPDTTCRNWTSNSTDGGALVGHFDPQAGADTPGSWNSAHSSAGCSQENLHVDGDALFYCFAID